ncbi:MAG: hypothetical protein MJ071_02170 [Oscillospiraceae bacterium]|nr:hypothetical protein [Oscillospiraceae bacterium]
MANKQKLRVQRSKEPKENVSRQTEAEGAFAKKQYTLKDCMKLGIIANLLFIAFIIVCLVYYYSFSKFELGALYVLYEIVAYTIETTAFVLFTLGVYWLDRLVRARGVMKVLLISYIVVEVVLMLFEFQFLPWTFYNGMSPILIVGHVIFSAAVSYSLLMLEPGNKKVQMIVAVTSIIILAGMFFVLNKSRVYSSILLNAGAYVFFFTAMLRQLEKEDVRIDCHGDQAEEKSFTSTMFSDVPDMVEKTPESRKLKTKAKRLAQSFMDEEHMVLTDKQEKFEYEFGVDDDEEDEEEDEE